MKRELGRQLRKQDGYTLVEVIISSAIGLFLMTGLTSVVLTAVRAVNIATARIEASSQIRSFQLFANDDFARSPVPGSGGCVGTPPTSCTIALSGPRASNAATPTVSKYGVTYKWDGGTRFLDRVVDGYAVHAATNVTAFSYSVEGQNVVVKITVTVQNGSPSDAYSQSQTMRFYSPVKS